MGFVPVYIDGEDVEFMHVNPLAVLDAHVEYPAEPNTYNVVVTFINMDEIVYPFETIQEARNFIRRLGDVT